MFYVVDDLKLMFKTYFYCYLVIMATHLVAVGLNSIFKCSKKNFVWTAIQIMIGCNTYKLLVIYLQMQLLKLSLLILSTSVAIMMHISSFSKLTYRHHQRTKYYANANQISLSKAETYSLINSHVITTLKIFDVIFISTYFMLIKMSEIKHMSIFAALFCIACYLNNLTYRSVYNYTIGRFIELVN